MTSWRRSTDDTVADCRRPRSSAAPSFFSSWVLSFRVSTFGIQEAAQPSRESTFCCKRPPAPLCSPSSSSGACSQDSHLFVTRLRSAGPLHRALPRQLVHSHDELDRHLQRRHYDLFAVRRARQDQDGSVNNFGENGQNGNDGRQYDHPTA